MTMLTENQSFLTVQETADLFRVDPRTIRNWIKSGKLRARRVAGSKGMLIAREDAHHLLEEVPTHLDTQTFQPSLIDRLGTPEGRARAVALLENLGEDRALEEQRMAWEHLQKTRENHPIQFRRWDVNTWQRLEKDE